MKMSPGIRRELRSNIAVALRVISPSPEGASSFSLKAERSTSVADVTSTARTHLELASELLDLVQHLSFVFEHYSVQHSSVHDNTPPLPTRTQGAIHGKCPHREGNERSCLLEPGEAPHADIQHSICRLFRRRNTEEGDR